MSDAVLDNLNANPSREKAVLQGQFSLPHGWLGRLVGWWMTRSNRALNRLAIYHLKVQPADRILEIGCGPGDAIALLGRRSRAALVAGIDPSPEMIEQAMARNEAAVHAGWVHLQQGAVESLPYDDGLFDKVFAVSNFLVWESPQQGLAEVRRVLKPGGVLVICQRKAPRRPRWWKSPGLTKQEMAFAISELDAAGFEDVLIKRGRFGRRQLCLVGRTAFTPGTNPAT